MRPSLVAFYSLCLFAMGSAFCQAGRRMDQSQRRDPGLMARMTNWRFHETRPLSRLRARNLSNEDRSLFIAASKPKL